MDQEVLTMQYTRNQAHALTHEMPDDAFGCADVINDDNRIDAYACATFDDASELWTVAVFDLDHGWRLGWLV
jgi:hypothetical protein